MSAAALARRLTWLGVFAAASGMAGDIELGQRLYRDGILASGLAAQASLASGATLEGAQAACVRCHRRSGLGGNEGSTTIRPIAAQHLFQPANVPNPRLYAKQALAPNTRPAYDDASFARALREGIDAAGRPLPGPMPRYALSNADAGNLTAYLRTLSATPSPGVTDSEIHFATLVDTAADPARTQAMLSVLEAYVRGKNAGTRLETQRAQRSGWEMKRKHQAYRKWRLHVWTLSGPPEAWPDQLAAHYRQQPVFAVLSGIGAGSWQPVHDFCEQQELPCLFPHVALPPSEPGDYALYFSRGLALEAETLAQHLPDAISGQVVQVFREGGLGAGAASALRRAWPGAGRLTDLPVARGAHLDADFWRRVRRDQPAATLVLWLAADDLAGLASLDATARPERLYLSGSLIDPLQLPASLQAGSRLAYPFELPQRIGPRLLRLRGWLRDTTLPPGEERIALNTAFAAAQAGEAVMHLVDNFQRDYFIERIEHSLENATVTSAYPHPTLGPGQRFASKGCHIVKAALLPDGGLETVGDWIVP